MLLASLFHLGSGSVEANVSDVTIFFFTCMAWANGTGLILNYEHGPLGQKLYENPKKTNEMNLLF